MSKLDSDDKFVLWFSALLLIGLPISFGIMVALITLAESIVQ